MIIKLKNASAGFETTDILINTASIISVFEKQDDKGITRTYIFGPDGNTWSVEESINEVYNKCRNE
jgi:hypothetical protein